MRIARWIAIALLGVICAAALLAHVFAPASYATQFRELPNSPPSHEHWLGTDSLGRDRFSRLLYGTRVSLLLAPAAALLSTALAVFVGGIAGFIGGRWERLAMWATDLFLSLPWIFLLVAVRAVLPLNVSPEVSIVITFTLLGVLGWASSARVLCASSRSLRNSDFVLQARASGLKTSRLLAVHIVPNLAPILLAQFWISIPIFILAEANLSILGLGVAEPLPSWGSLLRELQGYGAFSDQPWQCAALVLLIIVVTCFQLVLPKKEFAS
jgi:ABC-type dipeptide/oligopeptide/nickel transport system permease subunit